MPTTTAINFNYNRFITSRTGSNIALFDVSNSPTSAEGEGDGSGSYNSLLRAALFGPDAPDKKDSFGLLDCRNIFWYKTEIKRLLYSLSLYRVDESVPGISHSPVKPPRKVPNSSYKGLDAPALQDEFYLNLVDWSSNNVFAVGLGIVFIGMLVVVRLPSCVICRLIIVFVQLLALNAELILRLGLATAKFRL